MAFHKVIQNRTTYLVTIRVVACCRWLISCRQKKALRVVLSRANPLTEDTTYVPANVSSIVNANRVAEVIRDHRRKIVPKHIIRGMMNMKPIQSSLKRWIEQNDSFKERYEAMKQETLAHPHIQQFLKQHPEITEVEIDKRLNKLYEYTTQSIRCDRCANFESCHNIVQGYSPTLSYVNNEIHVAYEKCPNHIIYEQRVEDDQLIQSVYMPKEILHARMKGFFPDHKRKVAMDKAHEFIEAAKTNLPEKGLFLSGPFGVGKTYLLGAIANELQLYQISSMLIYMPEFVREMRDAIQTNTVQEKIDLFKKADVLMLDDIGAETMSAWFRDEVLGSILQYRMMERLPVFFTSNYTMEQLETILATSTKGGFEELKSGRIMERIKQVSEEVVMETKNYRES